MTDEFGDVAALLAKYRQLPQSGRRAVRDEYRRFEADPSHPGLHIDRLQAHPHFWSPRITCDYRAVGLVEHVTITRFWIGRHKDHDREYPY